MIGPAVARAAAVIPGSLLVPFVGLLWLLALPCSEERHRYVEAITGPAMETARTGYERKSRPHLNESGGPNPHDREIGVHEKWPHRAGSHGRPPGLVTTPGPSPIGADLAAARPVSRWSARSEAEDERP